MLDIPYRILTSCVIGVFLWSFISLLTDNNHKNGASCTRRSVLQASFTFILGLKQSVHRRIEKGRIFFFIFEGPNDFVFRVTHTVTLIPFYFSQWNGLKLKCKANSKQAFLIYADEWAVGHLSCRYNIPLMKASLHV